MNRDTKSLAQEAEKNGRKLTLEWVHEPDGSRALVFDPATWAAFGRLPPQKARPRAR
jgi:hypothetical protein